MELREYWRVFKRRAWIPIVLGIVTVVTAGTLTYLSKPTYTATATVVAKSVGGTTSGQTLSFPEVATSNSLALKVIQQLSLDESVDALTRSIKVSGGHSDLYKVAISDRNPDRAVAIATAVAQQSALLYQQLNTQPGSTLFNQDVQAAGADVLKAYVDAVKARMAFDRQHPGAASSKDPDVAAEALRLQLAENATANAYQVFVTQTTNDSVTQLNQANSFQAGVVDQAAAKPDTTTRYLKIAYAAALALILGVGLIYALEYLDNSVRDPDGVEEMIGAPVVGIIPRASAQTLRPARGGAR